MPSTSFLHPLMDRKKAKKDGTDELAVVKAAAWAWYQHGSGSEGKPISEFDVTRTHRAPRPSRYRMEAMRTREDDVNVDRFESETPTLVHADNSLLDSFEIDSISKQLDDLIESRGNASYGKFFDKSDPHRQKTSLSYDLDRSNSGARKQQQQQKKKKLFKGFWPRHGVTCGSTQDVDTRAFVNGRQPGKVFR